MGGPPVLPQPILPPVTPPVNDTTYDPDTGTFAVTVGAAGLGTPFDMGVIGQQFSSGVTASGWIERHATAFAVAPIKAATTLISILFGLMDDLLALCGQFMLAAQAKNTPGYWNFVAALLGDLLGTDVDGTALFTQLQSKGTLAVMQTVGSSFVNTLVGEFLGTATGSGGQINSGAGLQPPNVPTGSQLNPAQGIKAAQAFMGFVLSFAVREGNTDFFADLIPLGYGQGFKDYATSMARSLGLGRMVRVALRPLFQQLIGVPLTWAMNAQFTPTLLTPQEAIQAFNAGDFQAADLNNELLLHGYNQQRSQAMVHLNGKGPRFASLLRLMKWANYPASSAAVYLGREGYTQDAIGLEIQASTFDLNDSLQHTALHTTLSHALAGIVDADTMQGVISAIQLSAQESAAVSAYVSAILNVPRKQASLGEWIEGIQHGVANVNDLQDFLQRSGYRPQDMALITSLALLKIKGTASKWVPVADLLKAATGGLISEATFQSQLSSQGYNSESIQILTALGFKASATPPATPPTAA